LPRWSHDDQRTYHLHDLPDPAGAVLVDPDWIDSGTDFYRAFHGTSRVIERPNDSTDVRVGIGGLQYAGGGVERWINVAPSAWGLTPAQARGTARALIAAADEAEQMNARDGIEVTR
jgi:hypothetical protein